MPALQHQKKQLESTRQLQSVVKTMKAMAAVNIRQYERAVESVREYFHAIEMGLQIVVKTEPGILRMEETTIDRPTGMIVFGSDLGMVGQFNENAATYTLEKIREMNIGSKGVMILAIGERVRNSLEVGGQEVQESLGLPRSISGVLSTLQLLLIKIDQWRSEDKVGRIGIINHQPQTAAISRPVFKQLFPLDLHWLKELKEKPWPSRALPQYTMNWRNLFASLIQEYFFGRLYRAYLESLASENAGRLSAMQVAEKNIDQRLDELTSQYNQQRQSQITSELLDIVSGYEALSK